MSSKENYRHSLLDGDGVKKNDTDFNGDVAADDSQTHLKVVTLKQVKIMLICFEGSFCKWLLFCQGSFLDNVISHTIRTQFRFQL